jgi:UDP-2,3-diacylglucosamine hydrolase
MQNDECRMSSSVCNSGFQSAIRNPQSAICNRKIGLVAGWGRYPLLVAEALKSQGYEVHCVGLKNHVDAALKEMCDSFVLSGVARIGAHIRYFRRRGVKQATLAGKVFKHKILFSRFGWLSLIPDLTTIRAFFPMFVRGEKNRSDDTLLSVVVDEYSRSGITMAPATDFAPQLLAREGQLSRRAPTLLEQGDIDFGWSLAKEMGRLDIGQSVAVKGRAVIAVEAVEGTDACIRRAGELCPQGGFTVVKVAKPQQDMRFDVPTIGVGTIESLKAAGASCLAIEAGKTIIVDEAEVVRLADRHGIAIVAVHHVAAATTH